MGHPQGQQHMAGVQGAAGAGAAGAGADARQVQPQQQALPLDALEAEADNPRGPVVGTAVAAGVGNPAQPRYQLVPHGADLDPVLLQVCAALLQRRRHGQNGRNGLGAAPLVPLLGPALNEVPEPDGLLAVQGPDALGGMELVAGEGEHVDIVRLHIHRNVSHSLDGVGVKEDPPFPAQGPNLPDGLDGADLVVGEHDSHQAGVLPEGLLQILQPDHTVLIDRKVRHLKALLLQLLQGVEHRVVLNGVGDDVALPPLRPQAGGLGDGPVVRLRAAAGEVDLPGLSVQALGHGLPGPDEGQIGVPSLPVEAAGVAVELVHSGEHRVHGGFAHGRGGRVVSVYEHTVSFLPSPGRPAGFSQIPI